MLAATYNRASHGDIIVVMGDLNAKVGADRTTLELVLGNQGIGIRNDNGERFVDFCNTNHLVIAQFSSTNPATKSVGLRLMVEIKIKSTTSSS